MHGRQAGKVTHGSRHPEYNNRQEQITAGK